MRRPRMSRIYYGGKFYDYPLRAANALRQPRRGRGGPVRRLLRLGPGPPAEGHRQLRGLGVRPLRLAPLPHLLQDLHREGLGRAGHRACQADWAAQRIKNLSLWKAVVNALLPKRGQTDVTSLIEEFHYPKYGPGMMWETARDRLVEAGGEVRLRHRVTRIEHADGRRHRGVDRGRRRAPPPPRLRRR